MRNIFRRMALAGVLLPTGLAAQEKAAPAVQPPITPARITNFKGRADVMLVPGVAEDCLGDTRVSEYYALFFDSKSVPAANVPDPQIIADVIDAVGTGIFSGNAPVGADPEKFVIDRLQTALEKASAALTAKFGFQVSYELDSHLKVEHNVERCQVTPRNKTESLHRS